MKGRESGMPEETYWSSFFDPEGILDRLLLTRGECCNLVEFGCGYGTFTLPAARRTTGIVTALDIEPAMVARVEMRARTLALSNVRTELRDFVAHGTGLKDASQGHAMVFNLLHLEDPLALLREAFRTLRPGATLSVIHWRNNLETPRGPPLEIRPTPEQCARWLTEAGFDSILPINLASSAPYHFGLVGQRPGK